MKLTDRITQYLEEKEYLDIRFDVNQLVRDFHPVSWPTLNKAFLELYGVGMSQHIVNLRIAHGKYLLDKGYSSFIYDLAHECGMASDVFNRHFKAIVGVTPTAYRDMNKKDRPQIFKSKILDQKV